MMFKSRRKKNQPKVTFRPVMTIEDSIYKFALDTRLLPPAEVREWMNLAPLNDDALDEDSAESLARLKALAPLHPLIEEFSKTTASMILTALTNEDSDSHSESDINDMLTIIRAATYTSSLATVTQLEDLGVIEYRFAR